MIARNFTREAERALIDVVGPPDNQNDGGDGALDLGEDKPSGHPQSTASIPPPSIDRFRFTPAACHPG